MNNVITIFLRRMRAPLLVLIAAYAVSIAGLVLMPGVDADGNPWRFDFFHAFYFVSFMASTIGFGELPYEFSAMQRLWTVFAIYLTVISWLYAIGTILALLQDQTFQRAVAEERFRRAVADLREDFYLVCGYGQTGRLLVSELADSAIGVVVVDSDPVPLQDLQLANLPQVVPYLLGDASDQRVLRTAGLEHKHCRGVLALTRDDHHNLQIAVAAKLLHPEIKVVAIAHTEETMANLASFDTNHIVNPFFLFADQLGRAVRAPHGYDLYRWLVGPAGLPLKAAKPPPRGSWILCGFGRFGEAVWKSLGYTDGITTTIVEPDAGAAEKARSLDTPTQASLRESQKVVAENGTEARHLRKAGIREACALVAGTDDDANNLSILMTARMMRPELYFVARENRLPSHRLYEAAKPDLVMQSSSMVVRHILSLLTTPLLDRFLKIARNRDEEWSQALVSRFRRELSGKTPTNWDVIISRRATPALFEALAEEITIPLASLCLHPRDRDTRLRCIPLMLSRGKDDILLPAADAGVKAGDRILFCGSRRAEGEMAWTLNNFNALSYVLTGSASPAGFAWQWLQRFKSEARGLRQVKRP